MNILMECVDIKKSICTSIKYWYVNIEELYNHEPEMRSKGFKKTGTKYNVRRVKGMDAGVQVTYVKYEKIKF